MVHGAEAFKTDLVKSEVPLSGVPPSSKTTSSSSSSPPPCTVLKAYATQLHYSTAASPRSESGEREEWLNNCPLLKDPPSVGQHIAVKRLSTDDAYCPVYSSYLEAEVMEVQGAKLILKFIDKIPKDGEEEDVEEVDLTAEKKGRATPVVEEVDWRDLNQPRLIPH